MSYIEFIICKMSNFLIDFMFRVKGNIYEFTCISKQSFAFEKRKKPDLEEQQNSLYHVL